MITKSLEISQKLAMVGLSCSANTPDKVHCYALKIVHAIAGAQVSSGTQEHITGNAYVA